MTPVTTAYAIADEPAPGRLAAYAVNPALPQIAAMVGGSWIGLPWLVFNAYALGSVGTQREVRLAALSPAVSLVLAMVVTGLVRALDLAAPAGLAGLGSVLGLPPRSYAYAVVAVVAVKLWFVYAIHRSQEKSYAVYGSMGGRGRNAVALVVAAALARPTVLAWAFGASEWLGWVAL